MMDISDLHFFYFDPKIKKVFFLKITVISKNKKNVLNV